MEYKLHELVKLQISTFEVTITKLENRSEEISMVAVQRLKIMWKGLRIMEDRLKWSNTNLTVPKTVKRENGDRWYLKRYFFRISQNLWEIF